MLSIDGAHGEGGGQTVRSALALAAVTGRAVRIHDIRARRPRPGLAAQHVTAARAVAALCGARLDGDTLGSSRLQMIPGGAPRAGRYRFDVAAARPGGSAGAVTLVLQALLPPLVLAEGDSSLELCGGTHMAWSPSFHYLRDVWLPTLVPMGAAVELELLRWGWFPAGGGVLRARIQGRAGRPLTPIDVQQRGALEEVTGLAVAANLPAHIPERMRERAVARLAAAGVEGRIEAAGVSARCAGAALLLRARYQGSVAGFTGLGARGKPAERVADEAVDALLAHRDTGAAVDAHLADQLILPAALADGETVYTAERAERHLRTCAWLVEEFGVARVEIGAAPQGGVRVSVSGRLDP